MPWPVVESRDGFKVRKVPATACRLVRYIADISSRHKLSTPFRLTVEEASQDGLAVLAQTRQKVWQDFAAGHKARRSQLKAAHSSDSASAPSSCPAPSLLQAPLSAPAATFGATVVGGADEQQQPPPAPASQAASAGPSRAAAVAAVAAAMAAVAQQCPGAAGQLTGSLVQLQRLFHGGLAGMYLLLGRCLGVGGFADVYEASLVPSNDIFTSSSNGHAHTVATVAAAAAAAAGPAGRSSGAVTFAVKVYHSSKPGVADSYLQHLAAQELHALELLRGFNTAVQLMAEGELVTSPTYSTHSETGNAVADVSKCSGAPPAGCVIDVSGSSSSKLGSARLPRCAVLELAQFSLHEVVQRLVRCSEVYASAVAHEVLSLLEIAQSGAHGYMITHRDLKPANILVRANGSIAVADFGACHITKATAAAAAAAAGAGMQTRIGTVFYAAPELRHEPEQSSDSSGGGYDGSVDVFAVGVIVVEMLAGRLDGLCNADEVSRGQLAARLHWEQQLQRVVDGELLLPGEVSLSAAALQFIGCCCGVAREREAAAAAGQRKRLTPLQLLALPWVL